GRRSAPGPTWSSSGSPRATSRERGRLWSACPPPPATATRRTGEPSMVTIHRLTAGLLALAAARPSPAGTLKIVTLDDATGKPLAARVSVRGADGEWRWGLDAAGKPYRYGGLPRLWSTGEIE